MGDRPPAGDPSTFTNAPPAPPPNTTPTGQRTFFSTTSAGEFFDRLQMVLDTHHAETLRAQETLVNQITAPITALTVSIERLIGAMPGSQRPLAENPPFTGNGAPG